jgi:hypothetical protein
MSVVALRSHSFHPEVSMRLSRFAYLFSLLLGVLLTVGCSKSDPTGMKDMIPGTGPEVQMDMKLKSGRVKEMPPDPPDPKAPPLTKQK